MCTFTWLVLLVMQFSTTVIMAALGQPDYGINNNVVGSGSTCECSANVTREIFTRLPSLIEAIGKDERTKWSFRGPKGERGYEGGAGPQGLQGYPGRQGERGLPGPDGLPGARGPEGERGPFGETGGTGSKGQKGEPAPLIYERRTVNGTVEEIQGEKGSTGPRGLPGIRGMKGDAGVPGISVSEKGDKGDPCQLPDLEEIRGPIGVRGPPGPPGLCRRCKLKKKSISEVEGPIYIPVPGPPGLSVVGEPGPPGPPGLSQPVEKPEAIIVKYQSERHMEAYDKSSTGALIFITDSEKLFIRTVAGWKELELGRFVRSRQQDYYSYSTAGRTQRDHRGRNG